MKILYTGVYRDFTGYGYAATNYILALDAAGINIVCRPIKLNDRQGEVPERILELESKNPYGANIFIQNLLPHMFTYDGRFDLNIGLFFTETDSFKATSWTDRCNMMSELWVPSNTEVRAAKKSGVTKPIRTFGIPCDTSKFQFNFQPLDIPELDDTFVFYFIGEFSRRKNLAALIKAFHITFNTHEPVSLMIKSHVPGKSLQESQQAVTNFCREIKKGLKLYGDENNYKKEIVISSFLSDADMMRLHATGDCFVMPSYGESWNIPCYEAMCMGKTPIVTSGTGMDEYISIGNGILVNAHKEPCFGMMETFNDLYTGYELCQQIDTNELGQAMRWIYEHTEARKKKAEQGKEDGLVFDYKICGENMKSGLERSLENKNAVVAA